METEFKVEKLIWDQNDFSQMGWHDSKIYGIAIDPQKFTFSLDIDYIFKWVKPEIQGDNYKFWVSPCTLIFENVWSLAIEIDGNLGLEIEEISREEAGKPKNTLHINRDLEYNWQIQLQQGIISFKSVGFYQFVRQIPILINQQSIGLEGRGGISFDRPKRIF